MEGVLKLDQLAGKNKKNRKDRVNEPNGDYFKMDQVYELRQARKFKYYSNDFEFSSDEEGDRESIYRKLARRGIDYKDYFEVLEVCRDYSEVCEVLEIDRAKVNEEKKRKTEAMIDYLERKKKNDFLIKL